MSVAPAGFKTSAPFELNGGTSLKPADAILSYIRRSDLLRSSLADASILHTPTPGSSSHDTAVGNCSSPSKGIIGAGFSSSSDVRNLGACCAKCIAEAGCCGARIASCHTVRSTASSTRERLLRTLRLCWTQHDPSISIINF